MRLFIAINFTAEVKSYLWDMIQHLKEKSIQGNFTREENLHLTLAFLGEVSPGRTGDIVKIMSQSTEEKGEVNLQIGGLDKFMRDKECLYWCGIKENEALTSLQGELVRNLKEGGFTVDDKPFKPHITLGRRCIMNSDFSERSFTLSVSSAYMKVMTIELMKSEHEGGKFVYTSIGEAKL